MLTFVRTKQDSSKNRNGKTHSKTMWSRKYYTGDHAVSKVSCVKRAHQEGWQQGRQSSLQTTSNHNKSCTASAAVPPLLCCSSCNSANRSISSARLINASFFRWAESSDSTGVIATGRRWSTSDEKTSSDMDWGREVDTGSVRGEKVKVESQMSCISLPAEPATSVFDLFHAPW